MNIVIRNDRFLCKQILYLLHTSFVPSLHFKEQLVHLWSFERVSFCILPNNLWYAIVCLKAFERIQIFCEEPTEFVYLSFEWKLKWIKIKNNNLILMCFILKVLCIYSSGYILMILSTRIAVMTYFVGFCCKQIYNFKFPAFIPFCLRFSVSNGSHAHLSHQT